MFSSLHVQCAMPVAGQKFHTNCILTLTKKTNDYSHMIFNCPSKKTIHRYRDAFFLHYFNTHETMNLSKTAHNVQGEPCHKHRDGDATNWFFKWQWNEPNDFFRLTRSVTVLHYCSPACETRSPPALSAYSNQIWRIRTKSVWHKVIDTVGGIKSGVSRCNNGILRWRHLLRLW